MALKTDYKNYVLPDGTTLKKYQMINNEDGTVSFKDVTNYTQQGDRFGADDINATNAEVNTKQPKVLYGTTEPSDSLGVDGDLYVMLEE